MICPCTLRFALSPFGMTIDCVRIELSPTLVPIYKKGKVRSKADSYRPISPTTSLANVMERLINAFGCGLKTGKDRYRTSDTKVGKRSLETVYLKVACSHPHSSISLWTTFWMESLHISMVLCTQMTTKTTVPCRLKFCPCTCRIALSPL